MKLDKYVGIPWELGKAEFEGADCWGLVELYFREECGVVIPRSGGGNHFRKTLVPVPGDVGMYVGHTGWHSGIITKYGLLHVRAGQLSQISPFKAFRFMKKSEFFRWVV